MTIAELLTLAGISLDQKIGFIHESLDDFGDWRVEIARIAIVCQKIPEGTEYYQQVQTFDPQRSLAIQWEENRQESISIISITDDCKLYPVEPNGLLFSTAKTLIWLGQSPNFMKNVMDIMKIMHTGKSRMR